jgi:hypothetical protein
MVGVVQLVERQVVILNVAGSSPVTHPIGSPSHLRTRGWDGVSQDHATSFR